MPQITAKSEAQKIIKNSFENISIKNKISDLEGGEQTCTKLKLGLLHDASLQATPGISQNLGDKKLKSKSQGWERMDEI